ncbi:flocculation protein FLO11-like [Anopheles albimanus]|nr:flocculation protein FLO11-like [Anopheles albimanus]
MDTAVLISCLALVGTLLIVLLLLCRLVQPYDIAWFLSNREDKLNLSKMRLYNANGYLMHSGSEILLGSTGSFRRFDSVDRDYKPQYQGSGPGGGAVVVPPWRHSIEEPDTIPPQPLRPAPSPRESKLAREKPIHRQTSEPKPASQSIIISPIPRPVPRKQHSAPISFPLPLLASPREKRTPITTNTSTNPFAVGAGAGAGGPLREEDPLCEDGPAMTMTTTTMIRARPQPQPQPAPAAGSAGNTDGVSVFRSALKSINNPFLLDSPTLAAARHNQQPNQHQQQQQRQQACVFNFDPAIVHSLFNRPVPGLGVERSPAPLATQHLFPSLTTPAAAAPAPAPATTTATAPAPAAPTTKTMSIGEEDPLRRAEKRLSKMENLRRMSRLIESNQLLLNIYQQFNRTITDEVTAGTPARTGGGTPPSPSPPSMGGEVSACETSPSPSSTDLPPSSSRSPSAAVALSGHRYLDSPRTDALDSIRVPTVSRSIKHILRNRSFSETEFSERTLIKSFALLADHEQPPGSPPLHPTPSGRGYGTGGASGSCSISVASPGTGGGPATASGRPYCASSSTETLHKTVSESFLGHYFSFGSERSRSATVLPSSSCESVASQSSVVFADLVHTDRSPTQPIAGYLCIALQPDKSGNTTGVRPGLEVLLTVQEAKDLVGAAPANETETFVRVLLAADESQSTVQTKASRGTADRASFHETFTFWIGNSERQTFAFQVFQSSGDSPCSSPTLIGEAELQLTDAIQRPLTTWLKLSDSRCQRPDLGELMFSLSYLPTAERLTVVVVKARNLALKAPRHQVGLSNGRRDSQCEEEGASLAEPALVPGSAAEPPDSGGSVFVKVYLLQNDQKVSKKKTSVRRAERFPIYNEAIIFSVPPYLLNAVQIRLSVVQMLNRPEVVPNGPLDGGEPLIGRRKASIKLVSLGHVIIGSGTTGKALRHWHQMLTALRKPVAMWHGLRSSSERSKPSVAGNATMDAQSEPDRPPKAPSE